METSKTFVQPKFISDFKILVQGETMDERLKILHSKVIKSLEIHIKSYEIELDAIKDNLIVAEDNYKKAILNNGSFDFDAKAYNANLKEKYDAMVQVENKLVSKKKHIDFLKARLREVKK